MQRVPFLAAVVSLSDIWLLRLGSVVRESFPIAEIESQETSDRPDRSDYSLLSKISASPRAPLSQNVSARKNRSALSEELHDTSLWPLRIYSRWPRFHIRI